MRRAAASTAVILCGLLCAPAWANSGLPPGVHINPGSPAANQYRFPIPTARNETSGSGQPNQSSPPLFGTGITPPPNAGASQASTGRAGGVSTTGPNPTAAGRKSGRSHPSPPAPGTAGAGGAAQRTVNSAGHDAWLVLLGGGGLVLAFAGAAGLLASRRPRNAT